MIDAELLTGADELAWDQYSGLSEKDVLTSLLAHDLIETYRYADDGPPPDVEPALFNGTVPHYPGWVVIDHEHVTENGWGVRYSREPNSFTAAAILGTAVTIAEN